MSDERTKLAAAGGSPAAVADMYAATRRAGERWGLWGFTRAGERAHWVQSDGYQLYAACRVNVHPATPLILAGDLRHPKRDPLRSGALPCLECVERWCADICQRNLRHITVLVWHQIDPEEFRAFGIDETDGEEYEWVWTVNEPGEEMGVLRGYQLNQGRLVHTPGPRLRTPRRRKWFERERGGGWPRYTLHDATRHIQWATLAADVVAGAWWGYEHTRPVISEHTQRGIILIGQYVQPLGTHKIIALGAQGPTTHKGRGYE